MKVLLLGKNGQVGWELQRSLAPLGELIALDRNSVDHCGDLTNLAELSETIIKINPDIIVNAAAYTAVDKAESDSAVANLINADAPGAMANAAEKINALLVHFSTDYVFNGAEGAPWQETDPVGPVNTYGKSKLLGERAIIDSGCRHVIFRTSWVYAARGNNFIKTMLRLAKEKNELKIINDQYGAPTGADLIADITALALSQSNKLADGIYHLAANGETTWYGYAQFIFEVARIRGELLKLEPDAVIPVLSKEFITPARRPLNSRLNCKKLTEQLSLFLPDWRSGVERTLLEILG
jgi:dTDP-4-dehydrorhamnose reductase